MNTFQGNPNNYFSLIGKTENDDLFQSFQAELDSEIVEHIFELKRITDEIQIRKNELYERINNNDPNRLTNDYKRENCIFSFDSMTGEFLSIEVLNEF